MYSKGIAVVAITRNGVETALKIKDALTKLNFTCNVYAPKKYANYDVAIFEKLEDFISFTYPSVSAIVAVMASEIIIRAVAPHIENKLVDPAIVSVDASGKFVISLLSGHYGGANELAKTIAKEISALPVITTASDVLGKQSIDELARIFHLTIANPDSLVPVNAAIVNGDRVALVTVEDAKVPVEQITGYAIKKAQTFEQALELVNSFDAGALITKELLPVARFAKPVTILKVPHFTIGLGARKQITHDQVLKAIMSALNTANVPLENVTQVATVDIKQDSQSMINAAASLGFNLKFISVDELRAFKHEDLSPDSKIVQKNIGVGGVCERAALIVAGKNAHLILQKQKLNGVTVAIAKGE